ncbi:MULTISPECIES: WhiB family transcriptional regulator [Rhodococcus]|uniref:Transcriptional regulator WhiB n=1 Tax=Rhodococcus opacus RKJ300 = JCM 13270 TaxID=1165867 RepID=I0WQH2_RHOOP|nr:MULTISPECIES: WhiB family transcriptional regulator [Rhodococcus]EID78638.1 WhiB family transcriptional regulator [Rhodococcus opacus RKJ300 = JCM 13270]QQZ13573.1 WhiB family transcriptional regulator [Rhodococcus sp. 21391]
MSNRLSLPIPVAEVWDWQRDAACRGYESSTFFHPDRERGRARAMRDFRAKMICRGCPVLVQCREHALSVGEPYGIWGGLSANEREELLANHQGRVDEAVAESFGFDLARQA